MILSAFCRSYRGLGPCFSGLLTDIATLLVAVDPVESKIVA